MVLVRLELVRDPIVYLMCKSAFRNPVAREELRPTIRPSFNADLSDGTILDHEVGGSTD